MRSTRDITDKLPPIDPSEPHGAEQITQRVNCIMELHGNSTPQPIQALLEGVLPYATALSLRVVTAKDYNNPKLQPYAD